MGPATQRISFTIGHVSARIDGEATPARGGLLDDTLPASNSSDTAGSAGPPALAAPGEESPSAPAISEGAVELHSGAPVTIAPVVLPDLSALPPALEAAASSPTRTAPAPRVVAAPPPELRLARPAASAGRGLRDDDVSGLYLAVAAAAALVALAGFLLPGLGRRVAASDRSVLNLP
jgi:hypothetical protein